ncbi:MAG TPA: recombinase family protein [Campylobacterales bacterium]|nr:recombinase family protein [Campylobacterales bacterium]
MNYILIRVNQKNKNATNEEISLRTFATTQNIDINSVFYDNSIQKEELKERVVFINFLQKLKKDDILIISSIETLGWRVGELVQIFAKIFDKKAKIICAQDNEILHGQMEAGMLLSKLSKTRAQNIKKGISKLGRPEGSRSKSKYDAYLPRIMEFLKTSRNISALSRELGISRTSLKDYIASRGL